MKNIRQIGIAAVLVILIGLIAYQYFNQGNSTIKSNMSDFSIEDTSLVNKIFIADMRGNTVLLERNGLQNWKLNSEYLATQHLVNNLLETVTLMTVKSPVATARFDKTIRDLASTGIKVEIYQGGDTPVKTYYIGTPNQNHTGTYMMLEGSTLPYLVHIEGFYGFLSPRFSPHANDWQVKNIFTYDPRDIAEIKLNFTKNPENGFIIRQSATGDLSLLNHLAMPVAGWDTGYVIEYLERFRNISFESWEETKTPMFIDSVSTSVPLELYEVTDNLGKTTKIRTLLKPLKSGLDIDGNPIDHDQDRMYALINDTEFVIVQYFVFDPLNQNIKYFYKDL